MRLFMILVALFLLPGIALGQEVQTIVRTTAPGVVPVTFDVTYDKPVTQNEVFAAGLFLKSSLGYHSADAVDWDVTINGKTATVAVKEPPKLSQKQEILPLLKSVKLKAAKASKKTSYEVEFETDVLAAKEQVVLKAFGYLDRLERGAKVGKDETMQCRFIPEKTSKKKGTIEVSIVKK